MLPEDTWTCDQGAGNRSTTPMIGRRPLIHSRPLHNDAVWRCTQKAADDITSLFRGISGYTGCMYLRLDCRLWAYWRRRQKTPQSLPHQILAHHQNLWGKSYIEVSLSKNSAYTANKHLLQSFRITLTKKYHNLIIRARNTA